MPIAVLLCAVSARLLAARKPKGAYGPNHYSMDLDAAKGMLILDVVDGVIAQVEVLNRNDFRQKLLEALP